MFIGQKSAIQWLKRSITDRKISDMNKAIWHDSLRFCIHDAMMQILNSVLWLKTIYYKLSNEYGIISMKIPWTTL